ncbi:TPA: asparagine synthetase B, partial [bacterium]|nr:asparagine synthetase B [bacterium]
MCGITGKLNLDGSPVDKSLIERMSSVLSHRGPDDFGIYIKDGIGIGHRKFFYDFPQPILTEDEK